MTLSMNPMKNLPTSSFEQDSSSFELLDERIRSWIWRQGWTSLRDAQEAAIPILLAGNCDLIIAAATAAGKTEAAFLPILSELLESGNTDGVVLYVSPLKALINDQWDRLTRLCEDLEIVVTPWHGDVSSSKKNHFLKKPRGILLITPESLEALFVLRGHQVGRLFKKLRFVVLDELHSFIDSERGKQLQSQLCRLHSILGRFVPRVGLSATLGDMQIAARFLRPERPDGVHLLVSRSAHQSLKILLRAVEDTPVCVETEPGTKSPESGVKHGGTLEIAEGVYRAVRGSNSLVFPNSRSLVERYTDILSRRCAADGIANEFWAHHGSLSKAQREATEEALKRGQGAATAVCTSTMEMGIDIGSIKTVAQIGPPPSVASLRQRLGRSGRLPGECAVLRAFQLVAPLDQVEGLLDGLHQDLLHSIASIQLLLAGWCESPRSESLHASTFVQQVLSVIAERGGSTASQLWTLLVSRGAFNRVSKSQFLALLQELGRREILLQDGSGLLLHGPLGEKLVNHHTFYAAFNTEEEFRVVCEAEQIGSLSVSNIVLPDSFLILAGRRWRVLDVLSEEKLILVRPDRGGSPPRFDSDGASVHNRVRQQMRTLAGSHETLTFLDSIAQRALQNTRRNYAEAGLDGRVLVPEGNQTLLFTWMGDQVNEALVMLLAQFKLVQRPVNQSPPRSARNS